MSWITFFNISLKISKFRKSIFPQKSNHKFHINIQPIPNRHVHRKMKGMNMNLARMNYRKIPVPDGEASENSASDFPPAAFPSNNLTKTLYSFRHGRYYTYTRVYAPFAAWNCCDLCVCAQYIVRKWRVRPHGERENTKRARVNMDAHAHHGVSMRKWIY